MGLARILVDGYSLLHSWPELAEGAPRHSEAAREELIRVLTQYQDATGTPITVIFDGSRPRNGGKAEKIHASIEVLYSTAGQTADDLIERAAYRLRNYGDILVVTNDHAEQDTVVGFGAMASSCENFIQDIGGNLGSMRRQLLDLNQREASRFRKR